MSFANYNDLLGKAYSRTGSYGLERIERLLAQLGNPQHSFEVIHVAGTNGKGSVCTKLAAGLPGRVGLFTSPHITTFRERIRVDGEMISEEEVLSLLPPLLESDCTFFELTVVLAFLYFVQKGVDIAVVETGLGGRLDATNVVRPKLAIITSIGMDHAEVLGDTLEKIAQEKAAILKPGSISIIGPTVDLPADIRVPPQANFLEENRAIAEAAFHALGLPPAGLDALPPCRFERHGNTLLDVAHNPPAIRALRQLLTDPVQILLGTSIGKDREGMLAELSGLPVDLVTSDHPRMAPAPHQLCDLFDPSRPQLICGSCFLMEEACKLVTRGTTIVDLKAQSNPGSLATQSSDGAVGRSDG